MLHSREEHARLRYVARIERDVVVPLHDIKRGYSLATVFESLDDVMAEEAAAADDEVHILGSDRHGQCAWERAVGQR
jgi:hypothetical protein